MKKTFFITLIFLIGLIYILLKNFYPSIFGNITSSVVYNPSKNDYPLQVEELLIKFENSFNKTNKSFYLVFEDHFKENYLKKHLIKYAKDPNIKDNSSSLQSFVKGNHLKQLNLDKSLASYKNSLNLFRQNKDILGTKIVLSSVAEIYRMKRNSTKSLQFFNEALKINEYEDSFWDASIHRGIGKTYVHIGNFEKAESHLSKALSIFEKTKERTGKAYIHLDWGISKYYEGKYLESILNSLKAGNEFIKLSNPFGIAYVCINLAQVYADLGEFKLAKNLLKFTLIIFKKYIDIRGEAISLKALGYIERLNGNFEISTNYYREALSLFKKTNHLQGVGECLNGLGKIDLANGNYKEAEEKFLSSLKIFKKLKHNWALAYSLKFLGKLHHYQGNFIKSKEYYWRALGIFKSFKNYSAESSLYQEIGELFLENENYLDAKKYFLIAKNLLSKEDDNNKNNTILLSLSLVDYKLGNIHQAKKGFLQALNFFNKKDFPLEIGKAYYGLGKIYSYQGYQIKSREYFENSRALFNKVNNKIGIAKSLLHIGISNYRLGYYLPAKNNFLAAKQILKTLKNERRYSANLCWLAASYLYLGKTEEAINLLKKVIKTSKYNKPKAMAYSKLGSIMALKGNYDKAQTCFSKALFYFEKTKDDRWISILFKIIGKLYFSMDKHDEAETYFLKSINLGKNSGDHYEIYRTYLHFSEVELAMDNIAAGKEYIDKALTSEFIKNNKKLMIETYIKVGKYKIRASDYEEAEKYFGQALSMAKETNNFFQEAMCTLHMGHVDLLENRLERARYKLEHASRMFNKMDLLHKSLMTQLFLTNLNFKLLHSKNCLDQYQTLLSKFSNNKDFYSKAWTLVGIGNVHHYYRKYKEALKTHKEAYKILLSIKSNNRISTVLIKIAKDLIKLKKYSEAENYLILSQNHSKKIGNNELLIKTNITMAYLYYKSNEAEKGLEVLNNTLAIARTKKEKARCHLWKGALYMKLGEYDKSNKHLKEAYSIFSKVEILWFEGLSLKLLGKLNKENGNRQKALNYFTKASFIFNNIGNTIDEVFVMYEIYKLSSNTSRTPYEKDIAIKILEKVKGNEFKDIYQYLKEKLES